MNFKINKNCYFTQLDEKGVVLDTSSGCYYELDEKACYLWMMIEKDYEYKEIISSYQKKFLISKEESIAALEAFISQAKNEGFLE